MAQDKVIIRRSGHQELDELDAADIPALGYEATGAIATHAGAADPHADRSFATSAIGTHAGAADPHPAYALESALGSLATQSGTFSGTSSGTNTGDQTLPVGGTPAVVLGTANTAGSSPNFLRRDDTILAFDGTVAAAIGTAATGASTVAARRDHVHPTGAGTPSTQAFGDAAATGTGPAAAMTDHKHAMMAAVTRASLVIDTGDSPQLAAVNVGHATDTTLARVSAGVLSVEGNTLYAAGGTDVPVADGGTGASTALAARANLGAASSAIRGLLPTGALYHTADRQTPAGNLALLATGRLSLVLIEMEAGVTITTIAFLSGTTALSVGVNQWFALFDSSRAKLAVTVDDTSTAWGANLPKPLNLSAPFVTTYSGLYYLGIMVKATTVPTLTCITSNANIAAVVLPITGGNSTTGLTDPASCPSTAGTIAGGVGFPYAYVS